ncbi:YhcN/YlaJ family sporulation lipoprotein [Bacillus horti]|uniref:Sporulation protein n=1 Tax=Caldalkalibacillus horti TaxID=77523 RepID=A0ABT9VTF3_9BACI|nr:YhcN/YlaJ family sporulation lipoprotein [Bacillus horti]MDQ0164257.1 hypothetical protein [Bacillus horti]
MKKAKKALASLTVAFAVTSLATACGGNQGAQDDQTYRGSNYGNYTINSHDNAYRYDRDGYGHGRGARGLFNNPMNDGNRNSPGGMFFGGGRGPMDMNNGQNNGGNGGNGMFGGNNGMFGGNNGMYNGGAERGQEGQLAQQIEQRLQQIPGVQDCQVLVNGNEVVAGVNAEDGQQNEVMQQVRQEMQQLAPNQNCYVTTDGDVMQRLEGLFRNNDGNVGHQFKQLMDDAGNKIRKITR